MQCPLIVSLSCPVRMRVGADQRLLSQVDRVISVRAMCSILVSGFMLVSVFNQVGPWLFLFNFISFCLGLCVLGPGCWVCYSNLGEGFHQVMNYGVGDLQFLEEFNILIFYYIWHKLKIQLQKEPKIQPTWPHQCMLISNQEILFICGLPFM